MISVIYQSIEFATISVIYQSVDFATINVIMCQLIYVITINVNLPIN